MSKKIVWLTCMILLCACLGGCQLAREDLGPGDGQSQDKIIGIYVTFAHLPSDDAIYAKAILVEEDGYETTTFKFEDIPGIALFHATVMGEGELQSYMTTIRDPEILDGQTSIHFNTTPSKKIDEGNLLKDLDGFTLIENSEDITLTGTLNPLEDMILYINNVFQTPSGDVYMLRNGPGFHVGGGSMSTSLEETSKDEKFTLKLTLTVEKVDPPEQAVFKEMNDKDEVIRATTITPENIPEAINLHPNCAYSIVETHSRSEEGILVSRILMDVDEESYIYKYPGERGFIIWKSISILPAGN